MRSLLVQPLLPLIRRKGSLYGQFRASLASKRPPGYIYSRTQAERGYIRGISSIYQPDSLVDAAAAAISLIEGEVFDC